MMKDKTLQERITDMVRQVRVQRGYSQEYMAVQLGMSGQRPYSRIETGATKLTIDRLDAILKVLDISIWKLLAMGGTAGDEAMHELHGVLRERIHHLESEVDYLRAKLDRARSLG
ncbi:MAG TPA: helix-turn-helix transcriptional regulator [Flavobacteriales bacterium]|nr:helix-turn-helix transcriptional regulator [Flavobacteriales bacterium]HRO40333.1 helix-turn-helix transcriptional regulator [Flavobacteriales bacterium]